MNLTPSTEHLGKGVKRGLPFEGVVLGLQGGGALGAYQAAFSKRSMRQILK
jgi:hypothetical protein